MSVELDTSGLDALRGRLAEIKTRIADSLAEAVMAEIASGWTQQRPSQSGEPPAIVTGELANSVRREDGDNARIGTPLAHGRMLEFGTVNMSARPWLRPAVERVRAQLPVIARATFTENSENKEQETDAISQTGFADTLD